MQKPAVTIMVKAARAAGNVLLRNTHRLDSLNVVEKARLDYATDIDRQAEDEAVRELRRAIPGCAILGEEGGQQGKGHQVWVIDPLDGTSNYIRGLPHYCVSIALVEHGEPVHGVIYDPIRNELFTASKGSGALMNGSRIRVSERPGLEGALIATGFHPRERERTGAQLDCTRAVLHHAEDIRRTGSAALDLAYVAAGRLDGYFEAGVKPWDIAAGVLLVREAGGRAVDFRGAQTGPLDGRGIDSRTLLAGNLKLSDALQKTIASSGYAAQFKY